MAESGTRLDQPPGDPDANPRGPAPRAEAPHAPGGAPGYQGSPQAAPGGPRRGAGLGGSRPKGTSSKLRWLLFALAILAVAALVWFLIPKGEQPQQGPGARGGAGRGGFGGGFGGPTTVGVATVQTSEAPVYLDALGTVTPVANVIVRSQVSGQLMSVGFREGQMVTKGQFLAQIDPRPFQQQLAQAEGVLARDEAQLANARIQLQRFQTLLAQDSIARQDVDNQAATVRQLEGTIKSDQAAIAAQRLNLTYARVTAPVSGRVGLRRVDAGNFVTSGDANGIVVITQVAPIDVAFSIPEDNLQKVNARTRSGAVLPVTAFDRAQSGELAKGTLLTLDNAVDTATGTVRAKARFTNASGELFPNQFVNIRLLVDTLRNALMIPSSAVLRGSQGLFVYVINQDRTVSVRAVTTGSSSGDRTVITSGLQAGERVVTDGTDRLRDGARVILPGDCIPNMATGGGGDRRGQGGPGGFQGGQGGGPGAGQAGGFNRQNAGQGGGARAGAAGCPPGQVRAQSPAGSTAQSGQASGTIPSSPQPMAPPPGASEATGVPAVRPNAGAPAGQAGGFGGFGGQRGQGQAAQGQAAQGQAAQGQGARGQGGGFGGGRAPQGQ